MPPLRDVLTKGLPPGYVAVDATRDSSPASQATPTSPARTNLRSPLPASHADPDVIRASENGPSSPVFRIMPLQPQTVTGTVVENSGGSTNSSGGGSGSGSAVVPILVSKSVSLSINTLAGNSVVLTNVTMAKSFQLISIAASAACGVRLYGSGSAQTTDSVRPVDAPVPAELTQNIIIDVVFDTSPFLWGTQNIVGVNQNSPQNTSMFISIVNPSPTPLSGLTVTIVFVPLES
jgi:hypothetical protein